MRRSCFTVEMCGGISYDANHLAVTSKQVCGEADGETGEVSMISFVCSGEQHSVPAADVKDIRFAQAGSPSCSECHTSIYDVIGAGIHVNPKPMGSC